MASPKRIYKNVKTPKFIHHTEFAEFLDISTSWLRQLNSVERCMVGMEGEAGVYYFKESIRSYIAYLKKKKEPGMQEEKLRLTKAQTERIEIDNELSKKNLVETVKVYKMFAKILTELRAEFLSLSGRLATETASVTEPAQIKAIIDREVREALNHAATKLEGTKSQSGPGTKGKSKKKPV